MKKLAVEMVTMASPEVVATALREVEPLPTPVVRLLWRGRVGVPVLEGRLSAEIEPFDDGVARLMCRCGLRGPFASLLGSEYCKLLKEDMRRLAAAVCRRAEALPAASSDGRPPPARDGVGRSLVA